jgi:hypothetical protein
LPAHVERELSDGDDAPAYAPLAYAGSSEASGGGQMSLAQIAAAAEANAVRLRPGLAISPRMPAAKASSLPPAAADSSDDDSVPDVPSFPTHVPSLDTAELIEPPSAARSTAATAAPVAKRAPAPTADSDSSEDGGGGGGGGLFSKNALLAARSKMRAPPSTKGVSLDNKRPARQAARGGKGGAMQGDQKTPAMLESLLNLLLEDELDARTRQAAVANWMRLFDGKWAILQRLVDDYGGLVRKHALQPNTAYKKQNVWEKGLHGFGRMRFVSNLTQLPRLYRVV